MMLDDSYGISDIFKRNSDRALYRLAKATGIEQLNQLIAKFLQSSIKTDVPVNPQLFYRSLKESLPANKQEALKIII